MNVCSPLAEVLVLKLYLRLTGASFSYIFLAGWGCILGERVDALSLWVPYYDTKTGNLLGSSITLFSRASDYEMWSRYCLSLEELLNFVSIPYNYWDRKLTDFTTDFFFQILPLWVILYVLTTFFNIQNLSKFTLCLRLFSE